MYQWLQRLQPRKRTWLLTLPGAAILCVVDLHLAPEWLSSRLADFDPITLTISQGQELILQGFSLEQQESPMLSCETRGEMDIDLTFASARLANASVEALEMRGMRLQRNLLQDAQEIRYLSRGTQEGEPCHNSFIFYTDDSRPSQDLRLSQSRLSQPESLSPNQFRRLQAIFSGSLTAHLVAPLSLGPGGPGLSCRKRLQIGNTDLDFAAPFNYQVSVAGGKVQLRFQRLSRSSGRAKPWPNNLMSPIRARAVTISDLSNGRAETILKGRSGEPTIKVDNLSLETDRMQVEVKGDGSIRGEQAPHFREAFQKRPIGVGAVVILLLVMHGGLVAFAGSTALAAIKVPSSSKVQVPPSPTVQIFVSYSSKDTEDMQELLEFLQGLEKDVVGVKFWMDEGILSGTLWEEVLVEEIGRSDIALLLVSQFYLDSDNCKKEAKAFLDKGKVMVPIILSACDWERYDWLKKLQVLPRKGKTLKEHDQKPGGRERIFLQIRDALRRHAEEIRKKKGVGAAPIAAAP